MKNAPSPIVAPKHAIVVVIMLAFLPSLPVLGQMSFFRHVEKKEILDTMQLFVSYDYYYVTDTIQKIVYEDRYALEIGTTHSKFHSLLADRVDSVWKYPHLFGQKVVKQGHADGINPRFWMTKAQRENYDEYYWDYPQKGQLYVAQSIVKITYAYTEDLPRIAWQIEDSTQNILGYRCQKALGHFRGRDYEVWFAPELPYSLGPWKLSGLPGLIVNASSKDGYFRFVMVGIEKPKSPQYLYTYARPVTTTQRKKLAILHRRAWEDPIGLSRDHGIPMRVLVSEGGKRKTVSEPGSFSFPYCPPLELE